MSADPSGWIIGRYPGGWIDRWLTVNCAVSASIFAGPYKFGIQQSFAGITMNESDSCIVYPLLKPYWFKSTIFQPAMFSVPQKYLKKIRIIFARNQRGNIFTFLGFTSHQFARPHCEPANIWGLEPQTTIHKWMFGETNIFYIKIWNHPIETTIYIWLFGIPGEPRESTVFFLRVQGPHALYPRWRRFVALWPCKSCRCFWGPKNGWPEVLKWKKTWTQFWRKRGWLFDISFAIGGENAGLIEDAVTYIFSKKNTLDLFLTTTFGVGDFQSTIFCDKFLGIDDVGRVMSNVTLALVVRPATGPVFLGERGEDSGNGHHTR